MYDFQNSTDILKFWTEKRAIGKTFFVFYPILMKLGKVIVSSYPCELQFHQVSSKSDEKQKKVL